jgi:putative PIN family toxin of toxin-antitoxin system
MKLVLDTDVVVAGLRSSSGASRVLLLAAEARIITPVVSTAMVIEYEQVLKRPEHIAVTGLRPDEIDMFLDGLIALADRVAPPLWHRRTVRDANDEMFLAAALEADADAIVTFNLGDYVPVGMQPLEIPVCRPGEILRRLSWRPSATSPFASLHH